MLDKHDDITNSQLEDEIRDWANDYGTDDLVDCLMHRATLEKSADICPISFIYKHHPLLLTLWNIYQDSEHFNTLPNTGGLFDQPNIIIEAFKVIRNQINLQAKREAKKQGNKNK